jgi:hypothetical protein
VAGLVRRGVRFLVSPDVMKGFEYIELKWPKGDGSYKTEMETRFKKATKEMKKSGKK